MIDRRTPAALSRRDLGHPVLAARDGDEAVDLIDNPPRRFSVLVTDFHMPGEHNGCDVAAHMLTYHPHVRVFIATGRPDVVDNSCRHVRPYVVVPKPFSFRALVAQIGHLIEA